MIASSSTFRTHLGRAIWDLSRLLHVGEAAAYTWLAIILWWIASGVACFLHSIVVSMQLRISTGTDVGHATAIQAIVFDIRSLMWDEWNYPQLL